MKKILISIVCIAMLFGCQKLKQNSSFNEYDMIVDMLKNCQTFEKPNFQVRLIYNELDAGYRYDVIIDEVQFDMYDIEALCYNESSSDEMCPTIGLFDEEQYHLKKDYIDKANGFYKGIQLSGTSSQMNDVLLFIRFYTDEQLTCKYEKYIKVEVQ